MDWSDLALSTARGASLAALLSGFGALVFAHLLLPGVLAREEQGGEPIARAVGRLAWVSIAAALLLTLVWLWLQTSAMASVSGARGIGAALPTVALHTQFGNLLIARLALLAFALAIASPLSPRATVFAWLARSRSFFSPSLVGGAGGGVRDARKPFPMSAARVSPAGSCRPPNPSPGPSHKGRGEESVRTRCANPVAPRAGAGGREICPDRCSAGATPPARDGETLGAGGRSWAALAAIGAALLLQAGLGHAAAMGGGTGAELVISVGLHVVAAGAWLGGLMPLSMVLRRVAPDAALAAAQAFTPLGLACVALLAGTGVLQAWELIGGLAGLVGTSYGRMAGLKIAVFAVLLGLATANRFVFTDRLTTGTKARGRLIASVAVETTLGLTVVLAAGRLASLAPSIHEQPTWPFATRPSLDAFADPDLARELGTALAGLAGGVALAIAALFRRRLRWLGAAAGVGLIALAAPHLDLLFVEAYPSSFYTSPTEFGDSGIVHGQRLFAANCAACHGMDGHGHGPVADLTAEHLWTHSDGDLFWWVSHGIQDPEGGVLMPGFAAKLSTDARWDVLDYVHALNAGFGMSSRGAWPHPLPVPQFDAVCPDGRHIDLDDLRGRDLLIVAGDLPNPLPPGLAVIQLARAMPSHPTVCVATGPDTLAAFSILVGGDLAGMQILADRDSWLRDRALPAGPNSWIGDNLALERAVAAIDASPVRAVAGHHHH